jgi:hypothetical protein
MKRVLLIEKRRKARELKKKGWTNQEIARCLSASKNSIKRWLDMAEEEISRERRGRPGGRFIKYSQTVKARIIGIRRELEGRKDAPVGAGAVAGAYRQRFGEEVSEWFIYKTIREYRQAEAKRERQGAKETPGDYPLDRLRRFGRVIMTVDFIGSCLACKYVYPLCLGFVSRVSARTQEEVIRVLKYIWSTCRRPELVRLSDAPPFGAGLSNERCIGNLGLCLLNLGISPFYAPARLPRPGTGPGQLGDLFSEAFLGHLYFRVPGEAGFRLENFHLEYTRGKGDFGRLRLDSPFREAVFSDFHLTNRQVNRLSAQRVFFCVE